MEPATRSGCIIIANKQTKPASSDQRESRNGCSSRCSRQNPTSCSEGEILSLEQKDDHPFLSSNKRRRRLVKLGSADHKSYYQGGLLVPVALVMWWCMMSAPGPPNPVNPSLPSDKVSPSSSLVVAANEMFDEANETPGGGNDGFNDDDDDDDGAMDSAASSDYPEADGGGGADDPDDDPDGGESRQGGSWMLPGAHATRSPASRGARSRREVDDRASELQRRRAVRAKRRSLRLKRPEEEEFSVDDGDEDAWVHDGVDDIHIDPETKQAASQLSHETEKSIDAEYEPYAANEQDALVNGTRVTTIAEVIPVRKADLVGGAAADGAGNNREPTRVSRRFAAAPRVGASLYLPAAYLSMDQVVRLMDSTSPRSRDADGNDD